MPYDNTLHLMGFLGSDPEGGYFNDGTAHAKLSLAVNEKRRGRNGEQIEHTEWFSILLREKSAEFAMQYLKKGNCVSVWGSIWSRHFTDKQGSERTLYEVRGNKVKFISAKQSEVSERDTGDGGAAAYLG
ncbi:single-stranded DNA-binding protein [Neisseria zoodegmatis]|uniref:Single-stranded DNA-binding protein n=1 Tax=Neisseria zoodegmatis TaxID=326523 RepID=A0AB38DTA8_9NEIS|nr:single-stranded DNA-binding protein [Neisseria zoodegmatis]OSI10948.1 hypothetical protein BWD10_03275 [Neisseria zoodegmatis]SNU80183.1 single-stranded DNA binding protein [Neisseria zoodegmatis]